MATHAPTNGRSGGCSSIALVKVIIAMPLGERLGGAEEMLLRFLSHADLTRMEPTVVFFQDGGLRELTAGLGISTRVIEIGRLRQPARVRRDVLALADLLDALRPDLLLNWMAKAQLYGGAAAARARLPLQVVWWQHGISTGHWMDRLATALPAACIGCSSRAAARAQSSLHPRRPTFVVHPGVEPQPDPPGETVRRLRRELGIPDGRPIIGMVGRLQPWKGQDRLMQALAALRARGVPAHGLIVGGDAHRLSPGYAAHVHDLVGRLGLTEATTLTGQVEEVRPYVALMDVLVNLSEPEPFGISLLEGMALGVPVVAVATGGPLEIVEHERSGLLLSSRGPQAIADALQGLLADPQLRGKLGDAGRERVRSNFTAQGMAHALQCELELAQRGRPPILGSSAGREQVA